MSLSDLAVRMNVLESDLEELVTIAARRSVTEALKALPQVIDHLVKQSSLIRELSNKFYQDNPDLINHKDIVSQVIEQVEAGNPGLSYNDILSKVVPIIRGRLQIAPKIGEIKTPDVLDLDKKLGEI